MDSAQNERLNVFGATGIAIGAIVMFLAVGIGIEATIPLVIAAAVAVACGVVTLVLKRPGKELGYVAIALGVVAILAM